MLKIMLIVGAVIIVFSVISGIRNMTVKEAKDMSNKIPDKDK